VILSQRFPSLFQHAANNSSSVKEVMIALDLASVFNLPLFQEAYDELVEMQETLSIIPYDPNANDHWAFLWGNDRYSSQKLYKLAFATMDVPRTFSLIWKCQCTPQIRVFAWLVLVDRLNTRVMLRRRNFTFKEGTTVFSVILVLMRMWIICFLLALLLRDAGGNYMCTGIYLWTFMPELCRLGKLHLTPSLWRSS